MSKWYEVEIRVLKVLVVEMPDDSTEEDATNFAEGEAGLGEAGSFSRVSELNTDFQIDWAKRCADEVFPLKEEE